MQSPASGPEPALTFACRQLAFRNYLWIQLTAIRRCCNPALRLAIPLHTSDNCPPVGACSHPAHRRRQRQLVGMSSAQSVLYCARQGPARVISGFLPFILEARNSRPAVTNNSAQQACVPSCSSVLATSCCYTLASCLRRTSGHPPSGVWHSGCPHGDCPLCDKALRGL